jgi:hypothetical protein
LPAPLNFGILMSGAGTVEEASTRCETGMSSLLDELKRAGQMLDQSTEILERLQEDKDRTEDCLMRSRAAVVSTDQVLRVVRETRRHSFEIMRAAFGMFETRSGNLSSTSSADGAPDKNSGSLEAPPSRLDD